MRIITISRQYGSGGDEVAQRLAELLGYRLFDKNLIAQAAADSGLWHQEISDYSEDNHKVRGFLDRLLNRTPTIAEAHVWHETTDGMRVVEEVKVSEDVAVTLVEKAIRTAHHTGEMIIVGRGGQMILREAADVLHVRIEAPMEERIARVKAEIRQEGAVYHADIEFRRDAQDRITARDEASADYLLRYYNVKLNDPLLYHMVLNTGKLSVYQAAELIAGLARAKA